MPSNQERETLRRQTLDGSVREQLVAMERDPVLNTRTSTYSANAKLYPSGQIPFVDKHLAYLTAHPKLDPNQYLSNLRLMLKHR